MREGSTKREPSFWESHGLGVEKGENEIRRGTKSATLIRARKGQKEK